MKHCIFHQNLTYFEHTWRLWNCVWE